MDVTRSDTEDDYIIHISNCYYKIQLNHCMVTSRLKRVKLEMESVAYVLVDSNLSLSCYDTECDLLFRQIQPLGIWGYKSTLYADETPLARTDSKAHRASNSNVRDVLTRYGKRDTAAD